MARYKGVTLLSKNKFFLPKQVSMQKLHIQTQNISLSFAKNKLGKQPNRLKGDVTMSNRNSNQLVNPNAREAMDKFKMEAASEVGVNLKNGYNGDLTSRQAGSVGGQMVKKMIEAYEKNM